MCEVFSSAFSDVNVTFYIIKDFYKQKKINEIFQLLPENSINFNLRKKTHHVIRPHIILVFLKIH